MSIGRRALLAGVTALALVGSACTQEAASYESVAAVVSDMEAAGVSCKELVTSSEAQLVKESGRCTVGGSEVDVFIFDDEEEREKWLQLGDLIKSELLVGPDWTVRVNDDDVRADLEEALNADVL